MEKILIVDDKRNVHYSFRRVLGQEYEILSAFSGDEALSKIDDPALRLILMDVRMPNRDGLDTLEEVKQRRPSIPVIMMTAFVSAETAIRSTTLDADDYLVKPFDVVALKQLIAQTLQKHASVEMPQQPPQAISETRPPDAVPMLGNSRAMQEVYKIIGKSAARDVTVLITGESGTGKELVARALHTYSQRSKGPFLAINCAAIPDALLESELFGFEKGAFSGAVESRPGKFELAHGGTLFLDEIGDMPPLLQSKLLRVLQEREISRLGGRQPRHIDIRIIAATNQSLDLLMQEGRFRQDLYYRLDVVRINLPPLRERGDDILLIANHLLQLHTNHGQAGKDKKDKTFGPQGFSPTACEKLLSYTWPGNVRELENIIAQAVLNTRGSLITEDDLPLHAVTKKNADEATSPSTEIALNTALEELFSQHAGNVLARSEQLVVSKALELSRYNQVQAARLLGVSRNVLRERMKRYKLL